MVNTSGLRSRTEPERIIAKATNLSKSAEQSALFSHAKTTIVACKATMRVDTRL